MNVHSISYTRTHGAKQGLSTRRSKRSHPAHLARPAGAAAPSTSTMLVVIAPEKEIEGEIERVHTALARSGGQ